MDKTNDPQIRRPGHSPYSSARIVRVPHPVHDNILTNRTPCLVTYWGTGKFFVRPLLPNPVPLSTLGQDKVIGVGLGRLVMVACRLAHLLTVVLPTGDTVWVCEGIYWRRAPCG